MMLFPSTGILNLKPRGTAQNVAKIILFAGQSNAEGRANDVSDYTAISSNYTNPITGAFGWDGSNYIQFQANKGIDTDWDNGQWVGAELRFLYDWTQNTNDSIYLLKVAYGGTGVYQTDNATYPRGDWNINSNSEMFDYFSDAIVNSKSWLLNNGYDEVEYVAFVWHQGEQDSKFQIWADAYTVNLSNIVNQVRTQTGQNMPFVLGRIHSSLPVGTYPVFQDVRTHQTNLGNTLSNYHWINTDSYGLNGDSVHYSPQGIIDFGADIFSIINSF